MSDLPSRDAPYWDGDVLTEAAHIVLAEWRSGRLVDREAIDVEVAVNTFWAHASDLLKPTVASSGIDRAIELAVAAALGKET